jgi:hypothetical protein
MLASSPVKNAPRKIEDLLGYQRNFRLAFEERLRAIVSGVPAYIRRRKLIEDLIDARTQTLRDLRAKGATDDDLRARAHTLDLGRINDLIDRHNRYYPIEANLPVDPRTGELLDRAQRWQPLQPVTPETLVARALAPPVT